MALTYTTRSDERLPTFPADVISGREENRSEAEDKFAQESRLRVLEYFHPLEGVEMNVEGDFGLQLVGK